MISDGSLVALLRTPPPPGPTNRRLVRAALKPLVKSRALTIPLVYSAWLRCFPHAPRSVSRAHGVAFVLALAEQLGQAWSPDVQQLISHNCSDRASPVCVAVLFRVCACLSVV